MNFTFKPSKQERGIVLAVALIFLVILSVLVVSLMRNGILEERMVGYSRDWNIAFQAAESALRDAEREIKSGTRISGETNFTSKCGASGDAKGLCTPNLCTNTTVGSSFDCYPVWIDLDLQQADSGWRTGASSGKSVGYGEKTNVPALSDVGAQPRYIIEVLKVTEAGSLKLKPGPSQKFLYRVTAVGFGKNVSTRVMLQANFRQY